MKSTSFAVVWWCCENDLFNIFALHAEHTAHCCHSYLFHSFPLWISLSLFTSFIVNFTIEPTMSYIKRPFSIRLVWMKCEIKSEKKSMIQNREGEVCENEIGNISSFTAPFCMRANGGNRCKKLAKTVQNVKEKILWIGRSTLGANKFVCTQCVK